MNIVHKHRFGLVCPVCDQRRIDRGEDAHAELIGNATEWPRVRSDYPANQVFFKYKESDEEQNKAR